MSRIFSLEPLEAQVLLSSSVGLDVDVDSLELLGICEQLNELALVLALVHEVLDCSVITRGIGAHGVFRVDPLEFSIGQILKHYEHEFRVL